MDTKRIERILWVIAVLLALNIASNFRPYELHLRNIAEDTPFIVGYRLNVFTGEVLPIPTTGRK